MRRCLLSGQGIRYRELKSVLQFQQTEQVVKVRSHKAASCRRQKIARSSRDLNPQPLEVKAGALPVAPYQHIKDSCLS